MGMYVLIEVTTDKCSIMNTEVYRTALNAQTKPNCFKAHWLALHTADGQ